MSSRRAETPRLAAAEAARLRAMLAAIPLSDEPFGGAKTTEPATLVALVYYHGLWERSWEAWQGRDCQPPAARSCVSFFLPAANISLSAHQPSSSPA